MYDLFREFGGENELAETYREKKDALLPLILSEIEHYTNSGLVDQDYSSRQYVQALRRIVGKDGPDPHVEHERKMQEALAKLKAG